jgi:hypothetical protein
MRSGRRWAGMAILSVATFVLGCEELPPADAQRVAQVNARHAARYELSTEGNLYLVARARPGVRVDSAEAERIFAEFFLQQGKRREGALVYLNLYDERGDFLYQLYYDPATHRIVRGKTEHY